MSRPGQSYTPPLFAWSINDIVVEIADRCGIPFDRINAGLIEGYVEGFSTTNAQSGAAAIDTLASMFLFDPTNYDGALHFKPRGESVVAHITSADLIDDGKDVEVKESRDGITIPRVVHLEYFDTDGGLTTDKQTSDRGADDRRNKAESTTQTTIIMRADDAARAVVIGHKLSIEEARGEVRFSLGSNWLHLTCADVITLNGERMRIKSVEIDDIKQNYVCVYDRVSAYQSSIKGVPISVPSVPPSLIISPSVIEIIDSHIINSADDRLGYYVAVAGETIDWTGAVVEISQDGGQSWIDSDDTTNSAIMGKLSEPLGEHTHWYRDDTNTLTVELLRDDMELSPATMTEMLNRANLAIVGDELINFSEAEQVGERTWELRGLLRGRKGTAATSHPAGTRFVVMDASDITFVPAELFELNRNLTFRVTSFGAEPGANSTTITFIGRSQIERRPAYLHTRRDGGNIVVSWQGVGRIGGGASVGMGAYFSGYRVTLGAHTVDTMDRTVTIPYTAGVLSVRQLNQITGAGPATTVTV